MHETDATGKTGQTGQTDTSGATGKTAQNVDEAYLARRRQRASEYFLEYEGLTGEMAGQQARALIEWASTQASERAADPACTDDEVDDLLGHIRRAVRQTVEQAPRDDDPGHLVELARTALHRALDSAASSAGQGGSIPPADTPASDQHTRTDESGCAEKQA